MTIINSVSLTESDKPKEEPEKPAVSSEAKPPPAEEEKAPVSVVEPVAEKKSVENDKEVAAEIEDAELIKDDGKFFLFWDFMNINNPIFQIPNQLKQQHLKKPKKIRKAIK